MNTGLTLRTIRIKDGIAEVRAGATLLFDSDPAEEEAETELKASAMLAAIREAGKPNAASSGAGDREGRRGGVDPARRPRGFLRPHAGQLFPPDRGARGDGAGAGGRRGLRRVAPDLVVLSPGPGMPSDFDCKATIAKARARDLPIFGVCLGLQALTKPMAGSCGICASRCTASPRASG
jgi:anthranilate synthase